MTNFLSHSKAKDREKIYLVDHLLDVARRSKLLMEETKFDSSDVAHYVGLLHDIGKLNPWYQRKFSTYESEERLNQTYVQKHSIYSAWVAYQLLRTHPKVMYIACIIAGHHTKVKNSPQGYEDTEQFKNSQAEMCDNFTEFYDQVKNTSEFSALSWDRKEKIKNKICFNSPLKANHNFMEDYVEVGVLFSSLLQADYESFIKSFPSIRFSLDIVSKIDQKKSQLAGSSTLNYLRTEFQKNALSDHDYSQPISIIEAPTGIGKTKLFLDMINKYREQREFERVYYFSPLLALTDEFELTLTNAITGKDTEDISKRDLCKVVAGVSPKKNYNENLKKVLVYNHVFTGTAEEHEKNMQLEDWRFEIESFNEQFIITTMQRFLMTIYSNQKNDKIKFISFKNSLFIIDEIQTIPKFLLPNLLCLLDIICKKMNSNAILVSATVPFELKNSNFIITAPSDNIKNKYADKTKKLVKLSDKLILPDLSDITKPILVMNNTRKKATKSYDDVKSMYADKIKTTYMSSGVRKCTRRERINYIKTMKDEPLVVISTQVMEAGVNLSFSKMFREIAPLDNIIQAMGRLDREARSSTPAILTIFQTDNMATPYNELEFDKSLSIIKDIVKNGVGTSRELYRRLEDYYRQISSDSESNREKLKKLEDAMRNMDLEEVWKIVKENVFKETGYRDVIVPPEQELDYRRTELLTILKEHNKGKKKKMMRKFSKYTASLPIDPHNSQVRKYFDEELKEHNILFPKKEYFNKLYDEETGFDKWTKKL